MLCRGRERLGSRGRDWLCRVECRCCSVGMMIGSTRITLLHSCIVVTIRHPPSSRGQELGGFCFLDHLLTPYNVSGKVTYITFKLLLVLSFMR